MKECCTSKITGCYAKIKLLRQLNIFQIFLCLYMSQLLMLWPKSGGERHKWFRFFVWICIALFSHLKEKKYLMIFIISFSPKFCKLCNWNKILCPISHQTLEFGFEHDYLWYRNINVFVYNLLIHFICISPWYSLLSWSDPLQILPSIFSCS